MTSKLQESPVLECQSTGQLIKLHQQSTKHIHEIHSTASTCCEVIHVYNTLIIKTKIRKCHKVEAELYSFLGGGHYIFQLVLSQWWYNHNHTAYPALTRLVWGNIFGKGSISGYMAFDSLVPW